VRRLFGRSKTSRNCSLGSLTYVWKLCIGHTYWRHRLKCNRRYQAEEERRECQIWLSAEFGKWQALYDQIWMGPTKFPIPFLRASTQRRVRSIRTRERYDTTFTQPSSRCDTLGI
jgi:hypothetical protein